jgi:Domain of unknown function (DUF4390)
MRRVDTTVSISRAWTRHCPERPAPGLRRRTSFGYAAAWLALLLTLLLSAPVRASEPEVRQQLLSRQSDGVQLSVRLALEPSPALADALLKGVPVYFVWQAEVVRKRWYWTDKRIGQVSRVMRLAYQPLTRRWRLSLSTDAQAGAPTLQFALHQNHDSLEDALNAVGRVVAWPVVEPGRLEEGESYRAQWLFRLDLSLLPRPFQIGMLNQPGWMVEVQRELDVPSRNDAEPRHEGS